VPRPVANGEPHAVLARTAGLRYVTDAAPGIRRLRAGVGFAFRDAAGARVRDPAALARIRSLAIPPAWRDVWICASPTGHLQATGRDARGRKQHRYHPRWREVSGETKFHRMIAFGRALPRIRRRVATDLSRRALSREKVLATIVRLLERTLIRVGNREYARDNGSFGLTTMRVRHVDVNGAAVRFAFRGKRGIEHCVDVHDRRLARIVRQCRELPGHELFQWIDEHGARSPVDSSDVNAYLRELSGEDFTSKDFRTWGGTVLAASALARQPAGATKTAARRNVAQAIEAVARNLGNTRAVCRQSYVHPAVVAAYLDGSLPAPPAYVAGAVDAPPPRPSRQLGPDEAAVLRFLQQRERMRARARGRPVARAS
jgi:DNA topoisomerase I